MNTNKTSRNPLALLWGAVSVTVVLVIIAAVTGYLPQGRSMILLLGALSVILIVISGSLLHTLNRYRVGANVETINNELLRRLEETEERYKTFVENFLTPIVIFQGSRIRFANPLFFSLTGYTPEEVLSDDFDVFSTIHEDDRALALANVAKLLDGEKLDEPPELRFVTKSGQIKTGLIFSSIIHLDGNPAIATVTVDITRIKEMEEELSTTKERLQYLLDTAPIMIFQLDSEARFVYANNETLRSTGYKFDEWLGESFAPIVHPDDLALATSKFEEGKKGIRRRDYKVRIKNAEGEWRQLHIIAKTVREDGQFAGSLVIAHDITEQQRLETQLERDKNFIDQLIENANAMIGVVNEEGKLIVFNKCFEEVTGFTKEEALGKSPLEVYVPEESREIIFRYLRKKTEGMTVRGVEVPIVSKEGKALVATWSGSVVKLPSGHDGIVVVGQDVTEEKRMHEELVQSKKLASIGELVSGVAHELNNPLTIVLGYSQLMAAEQALSEKHRDKAQKIFDAATRSKRIVENLLAFARKKQLEKQEININEIMEDTLLLREHNLAVNNVKVIRKYDETVPLVYADAHQLQQVFLNLINNAFDAMHDAHQGGTLEVKSYRNNGRIVVEVSDDGPGIPEALQEKVFDPFFTTKDVGKGTGLGMSLSYGIVKEHGGRIYLDRTYRKGARFVVEFPLTPQPATLMGS